MLKTILRSILELKSNEIFEVGKFCKNFIENKCENV